MLDSLLQKQQNGSESKIDATARIHLANTGLGYIKKELAKDHSISAPFIQKICPRRKQQAINHPAYHLQEAG